MNYIGGLRGGKCCGQGRQPQQFIEEVYYLLRMDEEPEQLEAAQEYLLRSWHKTAAINGYFFFLFFFLFIAAYIQNRNKC